MPKNYKKFYYYVIKWLIMSQNFRVKKFKSYEQKCGRGIPTLDRVRPIICDKV